jgi:hypothetical protein
MTTKIVDLGEFVVEIIYDGKKSELTVHVLDEGHEVIESLFICDDDDPADEEGPKIDPIDRNISLT